MSRADDDRDQNVCKHVCEVDRGSERLAQAGIHGGESSERRENAWRDKTYWYGRQQAGRQLRRRSRYIFESQRGSAKKKRGWPTAAKTREGTACREVKPGRIPVVGVRRLVSMNLLFTRCLPGVVSARALAS